jgi:hypothetical protein
MVSYFLLLLARCFGAAEAGAFRRSPVRSARFPDQRTARAATCGWAHAPAPPAPPIAPGITATRLAETFYCLQQSGL